MSEKDSRCESLLQREQQLIWDVLKTEPKTGECAVQDSWLTVFIFRGKPVCFESRYAAPSMWGEIDAL